MIIITDKKGNIKYCSLSVERFTGYKPEELIGRNAFEVIHPDDVQRAIADFGRAILIKDSSIPNTFRILHKDGSERILDGLGKNLLDNPSIEGFIMNVRDITERKKAEETLRSSEEKYRDLVEREKDVICAVDTLGFITSINSAVSTWGYTPGELVGTNFLDLIAPEWREMTAIELQGRLLDVGEYIGETMAIDKNGEHRPIEYSATVIRVEGKYAGARAIVRDIAERKKAEEKIERQARRFEALHAVAQVISQSMNLDKMLSGALAKACEAMDIESGCIFLLDFANRALGLDAYKGVPEQIVRRLSTVMLTDAGLDILLEMKEPVTVLDETLGVTDFEMIQKVAAELGARSIAAVPFFRGMDVRGVLVIFATKERVFSKDDLELLASIANEIAVGVDNIKLLERTREMSVTDELTGLYNRRHFFAMLDAEMNRAQRSGRPFSLVMLDLDGFKEYNDKFGHTNGDTILQVLAKILRASMRKSDMAFRYGGDEFAVLIPAADAQKALKIVERARAKWQRAPKKQSLVFESHIGFSTGIAEFPANAESADGLVFLADAALYQAKRRGGFKDKLVADLKTLSPEILDVATQDQVYALAATVDARDPYTYGHSKRVAGIAVKIARRIGMTDDEVAKLHAAALLHDIGKVGVPDAILTKVGPPTPEEWAVVKRHCAEGARIVSYVKELASIVPVILHHHEWYDGTGYPNGLKGSDIPLGARITSVADAYDTMLTQRPYRHVVAVEEACRELRRYAGTQFDPELVEVWCKLVEEDEKGK
jgi:diguanylate cyclase (GGDEF)-like protein/PAS domain S-box-containing protein/putative nucleotidyltransferase with HDIG domain